MYALICEAVAISGELNEIRQLVNAYSAGPVEKEIKK